MKDKAFDLMLFLCCGGYFLGAVGEVKQDYITTYELIAIKGFEELGGDRSIRCLGSTELKKLCPSGLHLFLGNCGITQILLSCLLFPNSDQHWSFFDFLMWIWSQNCIIMVTVKSNLHWDLTDAECLFFSLLRCAKMNSSTRTLRCLEMLPSKISKI